ncbi:MAG TPA: hypothetical protein PKI14_04985, partial [Fervidobacterium sp.]|nr:hypothetical protein [Fervidobacterium sp.]
MSKDKKPLAMPTAQEQEALFKSNKVISLDMPVNQPVNEITRLIEDLQKSADKTVRSSKAVQLALDTDPVKDNSSFSSLYKRKESLLPTEILKRIRDTEELIGGIILPIRARQVASFARPRANRFDVGFTINLKPEIISKYSEDQQEQIKLDIIPKLRETLVNCGSNTGIIDRNKRNLTQLFMEIVEDILTFGAFAIEVRKDAKGNFHSFRAIDAGTIHFINPKTSDSAADQVRKEAIRMLSELSGMQSEAKKFENEEYTYVQVIDGVPRQVFTDEELIYWSAAPSTDINRSGYPITPIERIVNAVTMHINLTTQNKLYFVNGRAAKNVIVFKSDNLEAEDIAAIKNQMSAHINSVGASHRIPVFGLGVNDEFNIVPMESGGRDMEFQYLADLNKRMIFAAYQMSPDEVAALSYLSRGTNSQAMSESNNEYKLEASRSSGLRPLLISLEDFLNERL